MFRILFIQVNTILILFFLNFAALLKYGTYIIENMFSTPQSKAFFSQQIVKGKLISDQLQLVNCVQERIWESKNAIAQIIKILWQPEDKSKLVSQKLSNIAECIDNALYLVSESNQMFSFEVSLRSDIKQLEHSFFKSIMKIYQQKIKQLKHGLLLLQHDVQQLEQKGYLPYVESPQKNNILACKSKLYQQYKQKICKIQMLIKISRECKMEKIIVMLVDNLLHKKQNFTECKEVDMNANRAESNQAKQTKQILNVSQYIQTPKQNDKNDKQNGFLSLMEKIDNKKQFNKTNKENGSPDLLEMLTLLHNWKSLNNERLKKNNRDLRQQIEALNHSNKVLKEGIRNHKKIMSYEENEAMMRFGNIQMAREEAIDFLREMSEDLQCRFNRRNIYMIISSQQISKSSKSCTNLPSHSVSVFERKDQKQKQKQTNLNDSFLDQCSYLISDRFIADEDDNQQMIV